MVKYGFDMVVALVVLTFILRNLAGQDGEEYMKQDYCTCGVRP